MPPTSLGLVGGRVKYGHFWSLPTDSQSTVGGTSPLLNILHLLFDAINTALDLHRRSRNRCIRALARNGVRFSQHFLRQEVQRAPDRLARIALEQVVELIDVRTQSLDLFRDVRALRIRRDFAYQIARLDLVLHLAEHGLDAGLEPHLVISDHARSHFLDKRQAIRDGVEVLDVLEHASLALVEEGGVGGQGGDVDLLGGAGGGCGSFRGQ